MAGAKDIILKFIDYKSANAAVKKWHYSGKVVNNSVLHIGVFINDRLGGVMQFGSPLDKRKVLPLVRDTKWNDMLELNRMAFSDLLPRNSESRAISVAMRLIKKHYPNIEWVLSFADGTQCGDGTIYRASGFVLTGIKKNTQIWVAPSGNIFQGNSASGVSNCNIKHAEAMAEVRKGLIFNNTSLRLGIGGKRERERPARVFSRITPTDHKSKRQRQQANDIVCRTSMTKANNILETGASSMKVFKDAGWKPLEGFQLRYIYFLNQSARDRLTVPIIPFSEIEKRGAGMYKGKKRGGSADDGTLATSQRGRFNSDPAAPILVAQ